MRCQTNDKLEKFIQKSMFVADLAGCSSRCKEYLFDMYVVKFQK